MRNLMSITAMAIFLPTMALAQVGPNPAVSGGSQDPASGAARDMTTAPMGNSPSMSTRTNAGMMNSGSNGLSGSVDTMTTSGATATGTSTAGVSATGAASVDPVATPGTSRHTGKKSGKHRAPR